MHISLLYRASGGQNESEFVASIRDVFGAMGQALAVQNENLIVTQVFPCDSNHQYRVFCFSSVGDIVMTTRVIEG